MKRLIPLIMLGTLMGCASIIEGSSQDIHVSTTPAGARCVFKRDGKVLGAITSTPSEITISKTSDDINITCSKQGYKPATYLNKADTAAASVGNAVMGGLIGAAVDSSTGAAYKYDSNVALTLQPQGGTKP